MSSVSTPANREIGFVSSSFSFRVVRAGGRGEAVRARVGRYPPRWASWELVSTWSDTFRSTFVHRHVGFKRFWYFIGGSGCVFCAQACGFIAFLKCTCCVFTHRHVGL